MRFRRVTIVALGLSLVLGGSAVASVDAEGPGSRPKTSGPVELQNSGCSEQTIRSDSGEVLGNAETCVFLYEFDTLSETDVLREYGAVWLQARFVPTKGWCAAELATEIEVSGGRNEGITTGTGPGGHKMTSKLKLRAGGHALETGRISQSWTPAPGFLETTSASDTPSVTAKWEGRSNRAVNLVSGVGYSYEMLDGAPDKVAFGFNRFSLVSC